MTEQAFQRYHLSEVGDGFLGINPQGELTVRPCRDEREWSFNALIRSLYQKGMNMPFLLHFTDILREKIKELVQAFQKASQTLAYTGGYTAVYPIKVNQQKQVVQTLLEHPQAGVEAGSKPELIAILAQAKPGTLIVCNGYKDRELIELCGIAQKKGHTIFIMIEKPHELPVIFDVARTLNIRPQLGIRVRLSSLGKGYWQNTGGPKSKFGLMPSDLLNAITALKKNGFLDCVKALHVHLGSQMANLRDVQNGLKEAARYFVSLCQLGVPLSHWDVGGGLGVDYEGTHSRSACSMNYDLSEYAKTVVQVAQDIIVGSGLPAPHLITEAGRAMTAHHAMLIVPIVDIEHAKIEQPDLSSCQSIIHPVVRQLFDQHDEIKNNLKKRSSLSEMYQDAADKLSEIESLFLDGHLDLENRAFADRIYRALCSQLLDRLDPKILSDRAIWNDIQVRCTDKVFCNFSLFQSLPDVWALEQIFPIIPTQQLHDEPTLSAVLCDLTCDSDGIIDQFSVEQTLSPVLPLPAFDPQKPYHLVIALTGAYQEILGDLHNLFGDTPAVYLTVDESRAEGYRIVASYPGQTIQQVLGLVNYSPSDLQDPLGQPEKWAKILNSTTYLSKLD